MSVRTLPTSRAATRGAAPCACGCGLPVQLNPRRRRQARYLRGHNVGRVNVHTAPDPAAPASARCHGCPWPLVRARGAAAEVPRGWRRHRGRGLCWPCYDRARKTGDLIDHGRVSRTRDEVLDDVALLREQGITRHVDVAARIGISVGALEKHLMRGRRAGDPRAFVGRAAA